MTVRLFALLVSLVLLEGCAPRTPLWHLQASQMLNAVTVEGAPDLLPAEFASVSDSFARGEAFLKAEEIDEADRFFQLSLVKGELLKENLVAEKLRIVEEERLRREEAERLERERLQALALEEEKRRLAEEAAKLKAEEQARAEAEARRLMERAKQVKEHPLLTSYTVKRGETLPQISAQPEVYGDVLLWPLLYRANRDQIRNPRQLWPGQVLRIPRNLSRDDIQEARRYAQERRLH